MGGNSGIVVLGMHRGGTSLTAELLHTWGAYCDEGLMIPADIWNPRGYWENVRLVDFNDRILREVESSWCAPPGRREASRLAALACDHRHRDEALELIGDAQNGQSPWYWKDPRLAVMLPFWKQIWGDVTYIVIVRDPSEVAESLRLRNEMPLSTALLLWQCYMSVVLLDDQVNSAALFVSYEELLCNGIRECERICAFLDRRLGIAAFDADTRPEMMAKAVTPALRRSRCAIPFQQNPIVTREQRALHSALQLRVNGMPSELPGPVIPETPWRDHLLFFSDVLSRFPPLEMGP